MAHIILAETSASVSEFKKNPVGTVAAGEGFPVAILNRNDCIPAKAYEALIEKLEDMELNAIADARENQAEIKVICPTYKRTEPYTFMAYSLTFKEDALKEWYALDNTVREQYKSNLEKRLVNPPSPGLKTLGTKKLVQNQTPQYGFSAGL